MKNNYEISNEQLLFLVEYAQCGLAANGRGKKELNDIYEHIKSRPLVEPTFKPTCEWHEELGPALFFKLGASEPAEVTSPNATCFDHGYHTHFMEMPKELRFTKDFKETCERSDL